MVSFKFGFVNCEFDGFWRVFFIDFEDEFFKRMIVLEVLYYLCLRVSDLCVCLSLFVMVFDVVGNGVILSGVLEFFWVSFG